MFKKLLIVGALATALIGGIRTASAGIPEPPTGCDKSETDEKIYRRNSDNVYIHYIYLLKDINNFANIYTKNGVKWYFKGSFKLYCGKYAALYERRG
ncbi:hypothetical protein CE143_16135 [Photorhabdus luminescens]|uniref:LCI fold domain-containing protein n=1 Tax=Photorhabdus akhurstii TaxID=171438 RepID=A0ABX8LXE1_9GAMM|nr:LCI fold-containing protein [Photorhabdus akhurstii]KGM26363.1 hypothetical protein KS18_20585 [Photorhabdus luminescens]MBS9430849.1 hypothetical protein [Photorhabdus akhurstii]PQQ24208.1 hypothetical protein C6H64_21725 [Photorhabdus luminescens]PQQ40594.1 hypothetical protein C6H65_14280 [Photorhabdus luminescens]QXF34510.1 hypothetical protein B0X70_16145 [Photorhabdus akhurstii]